MRLKRIELAGFKSFVDPTRIELGEGITSIVGPNGCGKSNIVDAIRWVLGEHSAKHLRGGVMDDLIFQGSDTRPPVAICDVELTFAIAKGQLSAPYHEMNEIRIRRRLTRDGGSDAFINGKMVRIKDIVDLFLDTGISTRAYAIVEQGAISRMITAKPEERRLLLEEAAGVMKYRSRRREAERKMEHTRQNMERVVDLLEEVRSQVRSLRQQASRAERFKALQEECNQIQAQSFAFRYRQQAQQAESIQRELAEAKTLEAKAAQALAETEQGLNKAREAMVSHETEAQQRQDRLRQAEQQRADLQQQAERQAGERRLLAERKGGLEQRLAETERRLAGIAAEITEITGKIESQDDSQLKKAREEAAARLEEADLLSRQAREKRDAALADFERLRSEFQNMEKRRQQAEEALQRLEGRRQAIAGQLAAAQAKEKEHASSLSDARKRVEAAAKTLAGSEQALEGAQSRLDACRQAREAANATHAEGEQRLRALRGESQELAAQLKHQDVPDTLRDALRSRGAVWVDESLQVPEGLEHAVAAALRGRAADVSLPVNPDLSAWKELFEQARETPVALFATGIAARKEAGTSLAGAIGLESGHPLHALFGHITLCDDIFSAKPNADGAVVSRDGWRMEPDGWLIPPAQNHTARKLALQRRQRECDKALAAAETACQASQKQAEQAEQALTDQQKVWQQAHLAVTEAQSAHKAATAAVRQLEEERQNIASRLAHLLEEQEEIAGNIRHWQEQQQSIGNMDDGQQEAARLKLEQLSGEQQQCEQRLQQLRSEQAAADQALALHRQATENMQRELGRHQAEERHLQEQLAGDRKLLAQTQSEIEKAAAHAELDQALREAAEAVEQAHQALNAIRQQGHELQQQVHQHERGERESRHTLQQRNEHRQKIEVRLASDQARLQDMAGEIGNRFRKSAGQLVKEIEELSDADGDTLVAKARELEERLSRFGPVNLLAIDEFQQASEREQFLAEQAADLEASLQTLTDTIARIDRTTRQRFRDVFEQTNAIFKQTFPRLFGGGRAELQLDSDDVLTAGVEVIAQPPGKRLQDITLLSGGEKALTAVALVFSIFQIKPAPFCILDEVDAPLDDANVGRFGDMIGELADRVQFLAISHNKITMQKADRLVGVSMPEPGVSRIVAVDLDKVPA